MNFPLTESNLVDVGKVSGIFNNVTNSYKFVFFKALLSLIHDDFIGNIKTDNTNLDPDENTYNITFNDLANRMIALTWFSTFSFKLNFGVSDKIQEISHLIYNKNQALFNSNDSIQKCEATIAELRKTDKEINNKLNSLMIYVPYRLIQPWAKQHEDSSDNIEKRIANCAYENKDCPYFFKIVDNQKCICIRAHFLSYILNNQAILHDFANYNFATYLQKLNSSVPAILNKIDKPTMRDALSLQRKFFRPFIKDNTIYSIYSHTKVDESDFALDHFIPWTFVVHNQIWNLIPITQSENSSKSNRIPHIVDYIHDFSMVHKELITYYLDNKLKIPKEISLDYLNVGFTTKDLATSSIDKIEKRLFEQFEPLEKIALTCGFEKYI